MTTHSVETREIEERVIDVRSPADASAAPPDPGTADDSTQTRVTSRLSAWRESSSGTRASTKLILGFGLSAFLMVLAYVLFVLSVSSDGSVDKVELGLAVGLFLVGMTGAGLSGMWYRLQRAKFLENEERLARAAVRDAVETVQRDLSLANLMALNLKQMGEYDAITKRQEKRTFLSTQLAIMVGFAMLVAGSSAATLIHDVSAKIVVGTLTAVGSLLSGYIARTFIVSHRLAVNQLNRYYAHPLEMSHLLCAERLGREMTSEARNGVYELIIQKLLWSDLDGDGIPDEFRKRTRRPSRPRTPAANGATRPDAEPAHVS
jgi:TRADD-N domain-containing protein